MDNRMLKRINARTALISISLISASAFAQTQPDIIRGPYISSVTQSSIIINCRTAVNSHMSVEYGPSITYGHKVNDSSATIDHSVTLADLLPSTKYHYRIIAADTTKDFIFQTAVRPGEPFVFVAYGDTRTNHDIHTALLTLMQRHAPLFVLNTGDLVASGGTESNWDTYFTILCRNTTIGESVPIFSCLGNHENNASLYFQYLHLPHNNPEKSQAYYSFDFGDAHFIALNTTGDYDIGSAQYQWLVHDLTNSQKSKFRFVFIHHPVYSSYPHGSTEKIQTILVPLFEQYNVDLVFSGHDHAYERTIPIHGVTYVVTGGGGAPLYNAVSNNAWTAYKEKAYHFCKLYMDSSSCRLYMIRLDGSIRDSLKISKTH